MFNKRSNSQFTMGVKAHKYQITIIIHKLEIVLSNPLSKISCVLRIGTQQIESKKYKAIKEISLEEEINFETTLYQDKKGYYQEKIAQLDVCLTNSRVTNSIGLIKLDLSNYTNMNHNICEKHEYMNLQKSIEYQGKIRFTIKVSLIDSEPSVYISDNDIKRDYSDVGKGNKNTISPVKRSLTPTIQRGRLKDAAINVMAGNKITNLIKNTIKNEPETHENEHIKLEKTLILLKQEKINVQTYAEEKNKEISEKEKYHNEIKEKTEKLKIENENLKNILMEERNKLNKNRCLLGEHKKEKSIDQIKIYNDIDQLEKNNEKILMEKIENQISLNIFQQKFDDLIKNKQNLIEKLEKKQKDLELLHEINQELSKEYLKMNEEKSKIQINPEIEKKNMLELESENLVKQNEIEELKQKNNKLKNLIIENNEQINNINIQLDKISIYYKQLLDNKNNIESEIKIIEKEKNVVDREKEWLNDKLKTSQENWIKSKQQTADILNLVFMEGNTDLMEDFEKFLTNS